MIESDINKKFEEIEKRLLKLEKVLLQKTTKILTKDESDYKGLKGGINFLIKQDFFKEPRSLSEVLNELKRESYHYRKEMVSTYLIRSFVKSQKKLLRIKEGSAWKYALRK